MQNLDLPLPACVVHRFAALAASRSGVPCYFSDLALRLRLDDWMPTRIARESNLTLGGYLISLGAGCRGLGSALSLSLVMENGRSLVSTRNTETRECSMPHLEAFLATIILRRLRGALGRMPEACNLMVRVSDPRLLVPELRALRAIRGEGLGVSFPTDWLGLPLAPEAGLTACREDVRQRHQDDPTAAIRNYLALVSEKDALTVEELARMCGVSVRAMNDNLAEHGTSLIALIDGAKCDYALAEMTAGTKSATQIGQELGYSSLATFSRSFKRWTGTCPRDFRRTRVDDSAAPEGAD